MGAAYVYVYVFWDKGSVWLRLASNSLTLLSQFPKSLSCRSTPPYLATLNLLGETHSHQLFSKSSSLYTYMLALHPSMNSHPKHVLWEAIHELPVPLTLNHLWFLSKCCRFPCILPFLDFLCLQEPSLLVQKMCDIHNPTRNFVCRHTLSRPCLLLLF